MNDQVILFLVFEALILAVVGMGSAIVAQVLERRKWERRFLNVSGALRGGEAYEGAARMERVEQAVDAIAVELERVGEGQRFVTKLLADRTARGSSHSPQPDSVPASRPPTA